MTQEITVTKTGSHYEMQFGGGSSYPVPENAIEELDDDLTPEDIGASVTFEGEYGGHKHMKSFDVETVIETPGDDNEDGDESGTMTEAEFDALEEGDKVRHVDESETREVVRVPEPNPLAGHVTSVELAAGATVTRKGRDGWEVVDE